MRVDGFNTPDLIVALSAIAERYFKKEWLRDSRQKASDFMHAGTGFFQDIFGINCSVDVDIRLCEVIVTSKVHSLQVVVSKNGVIAGPRDIVVYEQFIKPLIGNLKYTAPEMIESAKQQIYETARQLYGERLETFDFTSPEFPRQGNVKITWLTEKKNGYFCTKQDIEEVIQLENEKRENQLIELKEVVKQLRYELNVKEQETQLARSAKKDALKSLLVVKKRLDETEHLVDGLAAENKSLKNKVILNDVPVINRNVVVAAVQQLEKERREHEHEKLAFQETIGFWRERQVDLERNLNRVRQERNKAQEKLDAIQAKRESRNTRATVVTEGGIKIPRPDEVRERWVKTLVSNAINSLASGGNASMYGDDPEKQRATELLKQAGYVVAVENRWTKIKLPKLDITVSLPEKEGAKN